MFAGLIPLVFLTGCATGPVSEAAICDGTARLRPAHAAALVEDGGPSSRRDEGGTDRCCRCGVQVMLTADEIENWESPASISVTRDGLTVWQNGKPVLTVPRDGLLDLLVRIAAALREE